MYQLNHYLQSLIPFDEEELSDGGKMQEDNKLQ